METLRASLSYLGMSWEMALAYAVSVLGMAIAGAWSQSRGVRGGPALVLLVVVVSAFSALACWNPPGWNATALVFGVALAGLPSLGSYLALLVLRRRPIWARVLGGIALGTAVGAVTPVAGLLVACSLFHDCL